MAITPIRLGANRGTPEVAYFTISRTRIITASTSTTVLMVMVLLPATGADDALLSANAGRKDCHSGWRRGPGRALGELTPAELAGTVTRVGSGVCWAAASACC